MPSSRREPAATSGDVASGSEEGRQGEALPRDPFEDAWKNGAGRDVYLGRPRPAASFEQTPADLLRWAEARGIPASDDLRSLVACDEVARAAAIEAKLAQRKRRAGGGRKPKEKTQYDTWMERRLKLYHRLVRLPRQAVIAAEAAGESHSKRAASLHDVVVAIARRLAPECSSMAELAREVRKAPELGHKAAKHGPTATPAAANPFAALLTGGHEAQLEAVGLAPRLSVAQVQRILTNAGVKPGTRYFRRVGSAREKPTS